MPVLATNKRAGFDYKLRETFEAGLVLTGNEVKAIKEGHVSLKGAYITIRYQKGHPEVLLIGAHVSRYRHGGEQPDYEPTRERPLLLKSQEIRHLLGKKQENGLTLVPIKIYTKHSFIKLELALAEGKKKYDKREDIKRRELDRQLGALIKKR